MTTRKTAREWLDRVLYRFSRPLSILPSGAKSLIRVLLDTLVLALPAVRTVETGVLFHLKGLGDLIIGAPALEALSKELRSRGLRSRLLVSESCLEFARQYIDVDEVQGVDIFRFEHTLLYRLKTLWRISREQCMVAYQPVLNRRLAVEDSLTRATRAKERVGFEGEEWWKFENRLGARFYTCLIKDRPRNVHDAVLYDHFLGELGIHPDQGGWKIRTSTEGKVFEDHYLLLCPESLDQLRTWPLACFLEVARTVSQKRNWTVVIVGTKTDQTVPRWAKDLRGRTRLTELVNLVAGAEIIICNDSAPLHLGTALSRTTVAVGGSGRPARFFPYPPEYSLTKVVFQSVECAGCAWRCHRLSSPKSPARCIEDVTVSQVVQAVEEILEVKTRLETTT